MEMTTIGLDIAKNAFQVHGIDAAEKVIVRKQLRRGQIIAFFEARHGGLCHIALLGARVENLFNSLGERMRLSESWIRKSLWEPAGWT
jgi:hypothetical protein